MSNQYTENRVCFAIPKLIGAIPAPVSVIGATLERREEASSVVSFVIHRELNVPIRAFTLSYSFSSDSSLLDTNFINREYSGAVLNGEERMIIRGTVPSDIDISGGCVFISSITLESGQIIRYKPKLYLEAFETDEDIHSGEALPVPNSEKTASKPTASELDPDAENKKDGEKRKFRVRNIIIAAVIIISLALYGTIGLYLLSYNRSVEKVAGELIAAERYNEAYMIVSGALFKNDEVLQQICESAVAHYIDVGDYRSAYAYAKSAPEPFEKTALDAAEAAVLDYRAGGEIDADAYGVLRFAENEDELDLVICKLVEICREGNEYFSGIQFAYDITSDNRREKVLDELFTDGIKYYTDNEMLEEALDYIGRYAYSKSTVEELAKRCEAAGIELGVLVSDCEAQEGAASAVILADYLGLDSSAVKIQNGDPDIRSSLNAYKYLSAEQKREYHAQRLAIYKEAFYIKDGKLLGTDITDAVSVDTNEFQTVVLHSDGSVSSVDNGHDSKITIPKGGNTVQIAVGGEHVVLLDADGTVSAYGSNENGQCDTSNWNDIVAVAAGRSFTLGLKADGTLKACGSNLCGQCDVENCKNVVDIDACNQTAVLLHADGSVELVGSVSLGLLEAEKFDNVVNISAGDVCIAAETADGRYLSADGTAFGSCGSVESWSGAEFFAAGSICFGYVDANGTLILTGDGAPSFEES